MGEHERKFFVLDTNILLHEPFAIYSFHEHDVIIPMTVLEELDRIKDSKRDVARDARVAIRALEDIFMDATPEQIASGITLGKNGGTGTVAIFADFEVEETVQAFSDKAGDNRILNAMLYLQKKHDPRTVVLVTKDINMRLRAKGAGVKYVDDYRSDQVIDDVKLLTKGFQVIEGNFWDKIGEVNSQTSGRSTQHTLSRESIDNPFANQYLLDSSDEFAARITSLNDENIQLKDLSRDRLMNQEVWGIHPKNIYQGMALDALTDPDIELVILTGPAGCGKTILALASAIEQVVERSMYDKIIVTRNTPEIAESIGFLPGTEEDKMLPWLGAVTDTLEALHKNDESAEGSMRYIMEKANIQFKSINFMRGRSIQNAFVILDESQNLTASQLKTIITRCGEGTKIVCSGNLAQIDSPYLTPITSGLTYIVERFKNFEGGASIYLNGVVRSRLAEFAEENL